MPLKLRNYSFCFPRVLCCRRNPRMWVPWAAKFQSPRLLIASAILSDPINLSRRSKVARQQTVQMVPTVLSAARDHNRCGTGHSR